MISYLTFPDSIESSFQNLMFETYLRQVLLSNLKAPQGHHHIDLNFKNLHTLKESNNGSRTLDMLK
jgi:hypothetical protein